jgi:hypothetical protein
LQKQRQSGLILVKLNLYIIFFKGVKLLTCEICKKSFGSYRALNGHKRMHANNMGGVEKGHTFGLEDNITSCIICQKEFRLSRACHSHFEQVHKKNTYENKGRPIGIDAWNKGLDKNDERVKKIGDTLRYKYKSGQLKAHFKGKKHSKSTKQKISRKLSVNNKGGRCKWYLVGGVSVQGTWERDVAIQLTKLGISWRKLKVNSDVLRYTINGEIKSYTPDFYLPDDDVYLEVKGYWWGNDLLKMQCVIKQHPSKRIFVIQKKEMERLMKGEFVWLTDYQSSKYYLFKSI